MRDVVGVRKSGWGRQESGWGRRAHGSRVADVHYYDLDLESFLRRQPFLQEFLHSLRRLGATALGVPRLPPQPLAIFINPLETEPQNYIDTVPSRLRVTSVFGNELTANRSPYFRVDILLDLDGYGQRRMRTRLVRNPDIGALIPGILPLRLRISLPFVEWAFFPQDLCTKMKTSATISRLSSRRLRNQRGGSRS